MRRRTDYHKLWVVIGKLAGIYNILYLLLTFYRKCAIIESIELMLYDL